MAAKAFVPMLLASMLSILSCPALAQSSADGGRRTPGSGSTFAYEPEERSGPARRSIADSVRMPDDRAWRRQDPPPGSQSPEQMDEQGRPQMGEELDVVPQPIYERFSAYIRQTTGRKIQGSLPFSRVSLHNVRLPEGYAVSSGDRIEIQVWGTVNLQYTVTVDPTGRVFVPEIGSVQLLGVRNVDLSNVLSAQFRKVYKGFELRAVVNAARSVDITVSGQATSIGQRSIPSSVSVIGAALGYTRPAEGGSRRYIELRRGGSSTRIDLYCFSHGRCPSLPTSLQDGDVLHVPPRAPLVAVGGAVNRPGIYEVAREESVLDLIGFAGGLAVDAAGGTLDLFAFDGDPQRGRRYSALQLSDLCGTEGSQAANCRRMADGDFLEFRPSLAVVTGVVTLTAQGVEPLRFTFRPGMRLLDVVQRPFSRLMSSQILANVNRGDFKSINELDERLAELDLESVTLYRLGADSRGYLATTVDASSALQEGPTSGHNVVLADGDILAIGQKSVWNSARTNLNVSVRVLGEVTRPGRYSFKGERRLRELLDQAGGASPNAATWSIVVLRKDDPRSSMNRQQGVTALRTVFAHQLRQAAVNNPVEAAAAASIAAQAPQPGERADNPNNAPVTLPVSPQLAQLVGDRTVIYIDSATSGDLVLAPGDIVVVPPMQQTVGCYGAVFRQGEIVLAADRISADEVKARCGVLEEMSPAVYQFSARSGRVCKEGAWFDNCPPLQGGDFLVAVPDAVRKRGLPAFLDYVDALYKVALSAATLKVLAQ